MRVKIATICAVLMSLVPVCALSQTPLDCAHDEASFFCDDSWRGGRSFYHQLEEWGYQPIYHADSMHAESELPHEADVHIWISPPSEIDDHEILKQIESGARILVMDESHVTLSWYQSYVNAMSAMNGTYPNAFASHINNNPDLPVFYVDDAMRNQFGLETPEDTSTWLISMNHPTPIVETDIHEGTRGIYHYSLPHHTASSNGQSGGQLVVVRDESLLIELMLNTLDNRKLLHALLHELCRSSTTCRIHLFEPGFTYIQRPETTAEESWFQSFKTSVLSNEYISRIQSVWHDEALMQRINWRLFFIAILMSWLVLALILALPFKRNPS